MATAGPDRSIGFVGLGNLGRPMAGALAGSGVPVLAFDLDPARATGIGPTARRADRLAELAACPTVGIAVTDDAAVTEVVEGLLPDLAPGSLLVVHSTVLPETARTLAERAAGAGVDLVDAPVSGGAERAAAGTLTAMVGGTAEAVEKAGRELRAVAAEIFHVGPVGAGEAAKLANQLMMFAALAGIYEAGDLAAAHGVDLDRLLEVVASCTGDSWCARTWGFFDRVRADYDAAGTGRAVRPWYKDLRDIEVVAADAGLAVPLTRLLVDLVPDRLENGG